MATVEAVGIKTFEVEEGRRLVLALEDAGIDILHRCGGNARCTTCRGGTQRAVEIMRRIQAGGGRDSDFTNLQTLVTTMVWSNCFHGQFAMTTIKTALKAFPDEWQEHIVEKKCRAGVCEALESGLQAVRRVEPEEALALAGN